MKSTTCCTLLLTYIFKLWVGREYRIGLIYVATDKCSHMANPSHLGSQERSHFVTRAHMHYCMYFYPNFYCLQLKTCIKHGVFFCLLECVDIQPSLHLSNLFYLKNKKCNKYIYHNEQFPILRTSLQAVSTSLLSFTGSKLTSVLEKLLALKVPIGPDLME